MPSFLSLPAQEQSQILRAGAAQLNKAANILEKDVWVCWALKQVFSIPHKHKMCFKGGTSLSKAYEAIDRFSEDIDLTIDYKKLMGEEASETTSRSQAAKLSKTLRIKLTEYLRRVVSPFLKEQVSAEFPERKIDIRLDESGENILIDFDTALDGPISTYVPNTVRLEFGGRNLTDPSTSYHIVPYLKAKYEDIEFPESDVDVLAIQRTFWEKATAIHVECNRTPPRLPLRFSRHWADLLKMIEHPLGQTCLNDKEVLQSVIDHKQMFFYIATADYPACASGGLRLVPSGSVLASLEKDYNQMIDEKMFYEKTWSFQELIEKVSLLEKLINNNFSSNQSL